MNSRLTPALSITRRARRGFAALTGLCLLALTGCNTSSDCGTASDQCICTLSVDDSPAPDCTDNRTRANALCTCESRIELLDGGPSGCDDHADCRLNQMCDFASGACTAIAPDGCESDDDCGDNVCDRASGECVPPAPGCSGDDDCPGDEICDRASGACEAPPEPTCDDGVLNQDESDVDCGGGCAECGGGRACNETADCIDSAECVEGRCDIPLMVRSQMPRAGAEHVEPSTAIVVEFSDAVDPASVDGNSFIVAIEGESPNRPWAAGVPGRYEVSGRRVTFTPDAALQAQNTRYLVRVCHAGPCPGTVRDLEGNPLLEGDSEWTFTTLPVAPGAVYLANTRSTNGDDRVQSGDGQNALVGRDQQRWMRWNMRHVGGGAYTFRGVDVNAELVMASQPGNTFDVGAGARAWRNVSFGNGGTPFLIIPTGELRDGTPYYRLETRDGFILELACPAGFCNPANLQAQHGSSPDAWFLLP